MKSIGPVAMRVRQIVEWRLKAGGRVGFALIGTSPNDVVEDSNDPTERGAAPQRARRNGLTVLPAAHETELLPVGKFSKETRLPGNCGKIDRSQFLGPRHSLAGAGCSGQPS